MNFLALLLGLAVERLLTHLFHLREFRWLDPLFNAAFPKIGAVRLPVALALSLVLAFLLTLPVALASVALWDEFLRIPYFLFAVLVLLFSLGPRDLDDEVEDYCAALQSGDAEAQRTFACELLERPAPEAPAGRNAAVEGAIYVQANNRIFGVVFWFLVLGPTGAWLFRVLDLMRRRAEARERESADAGVSAFGPAARALHGIVSWIPARLLVAGYVLAGNFEEAMLTWRNSAAGLPLAEATSEILVQVGISASGRATLDVAEPVEALDRIRGARALVLRTLWMIWCPIIAILTLYDWLT